jgi:hypothetical protein
MASISFGLNRGTDIQPDKVNVGTLAITTYNVELRWDATKSLTRTEIILILEAFKGKLLDGLYTGTAAL